MILIDALQLDKLRKQPKNVVILDATWFLPTANKDTKALFEESHIIGARFLDISQFFDTTTTIPCMLMNDTSRISQLVSELGIVAEDKIIFYDQSDLHTSCRAWWMFKVFGHDPNKLFILNGGLSAWKKFGGKIETGLAKFRPQSPYPVKWQAQFVRTLKDMKDNFQNPREQVVDVRHPIRYAGGQESRPNMRCGHIPGSFCFPYLTMFETNGEFKSLKRLQAQLRGIGLEFNYPIVSTCGSGITSPILNVVLTLLGIENHAVYDGSFSEWGADFLYPGETSLAERPLIRSVDY